MDDERTAGTPEDVDAVVHGPHEVVRWTDPYPRTVRGGDKLLFRFSPTWTLEYVDPDLLASLKEWLREEHP